MKKIFASFAALLLLFSFSFGAYAMENEVVGDNIQLGEIDLREIIGSFEPQQAEMNVNFTINENYTVTIPASIELSGSFSSGFTGTAPIEVASEINSGKAVIVSLNSSEWGSPQYEIGGKMMTTGFGNNNDISKISFNTEIFKGSAATGKTGGVVVTAEKGMKAYSENAQNGVKVVTAMDTTVASNKLYYSVNGLDGLGSGLYSFPQTFNITVLG